MELKELIENLLSKINDIEDSDLKSSSSNLCRPFLGNAYCEISDKQNAYTRMKNSLTAFERIHSGEELNDQLFEELKNIVMDVASQLSNETLRYFRDVGKKLTEEMPNVLVEQKNMLSDTQMNKPQ